jgi:hypothetical protein
MFTTGFCLLLHGERKQIFNPKSIVLLPLRSFAVFAFAFCFFSTLQPFRGDF